MQRQLKLEAGYVSSTGAWGVNLDVATTTDTIEVDGSTYPRSFIVNIGAQVLF